LCCVLNLLLIVFHDTNASLQEVVVVLLPESKGFGQSIILQLSNDWIYLAILVIVIYLVWPVAIRVKVNRLSLLLWLAYIEVEDNILVACQGCHVSVMSLFSVLKTCDVELRLVWLVEIKCQALALVPDNIRWPFWFLISDNEESAWTDFLLVDHIDFLSFRSSGSIFKHLNWECQNIVFFVNAYAKWCWPVPPYAVWICETIFLFFNDLVLWRFD
jgi:hypothetical protein